MTAKSIRQEYNSLVSTLTDKALIEVERRARAILRRKPNLKEFIMAMGTYFFTDRDGQIVKHLTEHRDLNHDNPYSYTPKQWAASFDAFVLELDDDLKLTGCPMRFTADGPVVTEW